MTHSLRWGFGLSPDSLSVLQRLLSAGLIDRIALPPEETAWPAGGVADFLAEEWPRSSAFVAVGACGALTRLIAPLLRDKDQDPAVVVLDAAGQYAIPLLGGHGAGGEALARSVAASLGGQAVITG
ncbi:MAG: precorrin-3B C(17)-methyltransferase, partial [Synechococcaceae bacterium WB4_1_0192]|nr:precorrin-3B C(17)-methyltransferase [Synechococcaceae bacterium WB4_1_0192]